MIWVSTVDLSQGGSDRFRNRLRLAHNFWGNEVRTKHSLVGSFLAASRWFESRTLRRQGLTPDRVRSWNRDHRGVCMRTGLLARTVAAQN